MKEKVFILALTLICVCSFILLFFVVVVSLVSLHNIMCLFVTTSTITAGLQTWRFDGFPLHCGSPPFEQIKTQIFPADSQLHKNEHQCDGHSISPAAKRRGTLRHI